MNVGVEQGKESPTTQGKRVNLEDEERVLKPDWKQAKALISFLISSGQPWRADPVLQGVIVKDGDFASELKKRFRMDDQTETERKFLSRQSGVRIIGWSPFAGVLIYDLKDDHITLFEASSRAKAMLPSMYFAFGFEGLGRATPQGKIDFETVAEAIASVASEIRSQEWQWINKIRTRS